MLIVFWLELKWWWGKGEKCCFSFCFGHTIISCMLYLHCHLAPRTGAKERVNILQWRSISLLKSYSLRWEASRDCFEVYILQWVPGLPNSFLYRLVSSTLTFCSFRFWNSLGRWQACGWSCYWGLTFCY